MIFQDFKYERPDIEVLNQKLKEIKEKVENADNAQIQIDAYLELDKLLQDFTTMTSLVYIRHSINTLDEFYSKENDFNDENSPVISSYINDLNESFAKSKFRKELEERFGKLVFDKIDMSLKTFKPEIIEDLQEENKLVSEYVKLSSSAKIMFQGEERNLSQMAPFSQSVDMEVRKAILHSVLAAYKLSTETTVSLLVQLVNSQDN